MINLGSIIDPAIRLRNYLFDKKIFSSTSLGCKVISIGNITMGGTGKTPTTSYLYNHYLNGLFKGELKNEKIGIVVRSYKTPLDHPEVVPAEGGDAALLGDEALLLKWRCPEAIVVSGPNKMESAVFLLKQEPQIEVLLIDDGFQHRKLNRNLDIVLLDMSVNPQEYSWPLNGRLRESFKSLNRAQVVILTKMDQQNAETVNLVKSKLQFETIVLESFQKVGEPYQVMGQKFDFKIGSKIFGFCGIAKPENFKLSLEKKEIKVSEFLPFPDHHFYSELEVKETLVKKAQQYGQALTTEKDFMRLHNWPKNGPALFVLPIEVELSGQLERFYELLKV